jgi:porin
MKKIPRQLAPLLSNVAIKKKDTLSKSVKMVPLTLCLMNLTAQSTWAGTESTKEIRSTLPSPSSVTVPADPEAILTPEQGKLYYDRYALGDWGGFRTQLHNKGIDFKLVYFGEMAGNVRGGNDHFSGYVKGNGQSWSYDDQVLLGLDLDFQKLVGWEGASFEAYFTKRNGDNLGQYTNPAPIMQYQEVYGRGQTWRITNLFFKQKFGNDLFEWKVGLMPVNGEFGNFYAFPFENLTFCAGTTGNIAGYSQYNWPVSQWATDFKINVTKSLAIKVGVFAFNDYWGSRDYDMRIDNPGGTSGAVIPVEISWNPTFHIDGKDLPGSWNLTVYGNTNNRETRGADKSWIANAPGVIPHWLGGGQFSGDYGWAASIWQQVTAPDPLRPKTGLSVFGSVTWADPRTAFQNLDIFGGLYYWGLWSKRPNDSLGMAWGWNHVSGNAQNAEKRYVAAHPNSGYAVQTDEVVGEIFYSFDVYHGINIQPDLQYIIHPGGYASAKNQIVFGVQLSVPL